MNKLTNEEMGTAINQVWASYSGCTHIPRHSLISAACHELAVDYSVFAEQFDEYISGQILMGNLGQKKGRAGGIFKQTIDRVALDKQVTDLVDRTLAPINNHVCPCCGNDKVSKSEKSCWKCGGSLHS